MRIDEREMPYWKSDFLLRWKRKDSCRRVFDLSVTMDRSPPACKFSTIAPSPKAPQKAAPKPDPVMKMLDGLDRAVGFFRENWERPLSYYLPSQKQVLSKPAPKETPIPTFDLQDIPDAMRKIDMPVSAKLMERWFAGELNYSPTPKDEENYISQHEKPYPPSMIDRTTVKLEWVLKFERAREGFDEIKTRRKLGSAKALDELRKKLIALGVGDGVVDTTEFCRGDLFKLHRLFQFQYRSVEGSWKQKLGTFMNIFYEDRTFPDDLTGSLGSFNFYAAPHEITFLYGRVAYVNSALIYVKDNFTFTDRHGDVSQYLGHWNKNGVIIVPGDMALSSANVPSVTPPIDDAWFESAVTLADVGKGSNIYYPVRNSSYRDWQRVHHRGGDFVIFSDYRSVPVDPPLEIRF